MVDTGETSWQGQLGQISDLRETRHEVIEHHPGVQEIGMRGLADPVAQCPRHRYIEALKPIEHIPSYILPRMSLITDQVESPDPSVMLEDAWIWSCAGEDPDLRRQIGEVCQDPGDRRARIDKTLIKGIHQEQKGSIAPIGIQLD
jgi:hypothetical protein